MAVEPVVLGPALDLEREGGTGYDGLEARSDERKEAYVAVGAGGFERDREFAASEKRADDLVGPAGCIADEDPVGGVVDAGATRVVDGRGPAYSRDGDGALAERLLRGMGRSQGGGMEKWPRAGREEKIDSPYQLDCGTCR